MKLSVLTAYDYLVYVGIAILISTSKLVSPCLTEHNHIVVVTEDEKQETAYEPTSNRILHNELLFRY